MLASESTLSLLAPYLERVESDIQKSIVYFGPDSELRDACMYALSTGGKRFRPILVHMMAKAIGNSADVTDAALAVEFFHTASLIADDLPCMDNDDERRNKPSTHKAFNEATALLASYGLIAAGYRAIARGAAKNPFNNDCVCRLALECATYNTGMTGATGGQFLDINPPDLSLGTIKQIIQMKTVSLFEISFVLGWLYGGGSLNSLDLVKKASAHFGLAFQIADDIDDIEQDAQNEHAVNMAALFGIEAAHAKVREELGSFYSVMGGLGVDYCEFKVLGEQLCCPPHKN